MRISRSRRLVLALFMASACTIALVGSAGARPLVAAPTITKISPNHGPIGEKVTISGANLVGAMVEFNGDGQRVQATNVTVDGTGSSVTVNVPADTPTGAHPIVVTTPGGTVMSTVNFTVGPQMSGPAIVKPRIASFAPTRAKVGAKVTIKGANLDGAQWVKFGGVKAVFTVPSKTMIIAHVPKKAHTGTITIKTATGVATTSMRFTVLGSAGI